MSPEQAQGESIDPRSDIFSLGVLLYEMVAGHPPFAGPTESHVRVSIIDHDPAPLTSQSPEAPRHLERIVSKALAKDKAKDIKPSPTSNWISSNYGRSCIFQTPRFTAKRRLKLQDRLVQLPL